MVIRLFPIFLLLAALFLVGCASSGRTHGSLSEAMDRASREDPEDRHMESEADDGDDPSWFFEEDKDSDEKGDSDSVSPLDSIPTASQFAISIGNGAITSEKFTGFRGVGIEYSLLTQEKFRIDFEFEIYQAPIQETSGLNQSLKGGVFLFNFGVDLNFFTTPEHTFFGNYFFIGGGLSLLSWEYQHPIYLEHDYDTERITSDSVPGIDLHAGVGINVMQTDFLRIGAEVMPGILLWNPETTEGFTNDVFKPFAYIKVNFVIRFQMTGFRV